MFFCFGHWPVSERRGPNGLYRNLLSVAISWECFTKQDTGLLICLLCFAQLFFPLFPSSLLSSLSLVHPGSSALWRLPTSRFFSRNGGLNIIFLTHSTHTDTQISRLKQGLWGCEAAIMLSYGVSLPNWYWEELGNMFWNMMYWSTRSTVYKT